jgi:DNA repair protein RadC
MPPVAIKCSEDAVRAIRPAFPRRVIGLQECFAVLCLDARNRVIGRPQMISMGTVNIVEVHPRDIFRTAIKRNATSIIIAHNHPSGSLETSVDDKALTRRVAEAGKLLGIPLTDHLIVTREGYLSMHEAGVL